MNFIISKIVNNTMTHIAKSALSRRTYLRAAGAALHFHVMEFVYVG